MIRVRRALAFDDVLLAPKLNKVTSRSKVEKHKFGFGGVSLDLPIVAANMDTVCGGNMAKAMHKNGGLGIIHRAQSILLQVNSLKRVEEFIYSENPNETALIGAAVGIGDEGFERAKECIKAGANVICIDVAHGYDPRVKGLLGNLLADSDVMIIAGNIATVNAADYLWEVVVKVGGEGRVLLKAGVGGGSMCTTRIRTGCGLPTLQSVFEIADAGYPVIADGGIRNSGDIVKCFAVGAHAVMVGSLLAGTDEAPGTPVNGFKPYRGSASGEAKKDFYGKEEYVEGVATNIACKGPVTDVLQYLADGMRSGVSYCGVTKLEELHGSVDFVEVTYAGVLESRPHGVTP